MTSKEIRAMNFNATWNQYFDLLQEIAARMAERDERTPAPEATETPTERDLFCVWWDKNASDSEGVKNLDLYAARQSFHAGWNAAKGEVPAAPEAAVTAITDAQWDALCRDIQDRRGLKWEWNKIDDDVKLGIRRAWSAILSNVPAPETAGAAPPSDAVTRDKERKEQIAEVETGIDLLCKVWPAYYPSDSATMERIVDVEKARLAELKRGLREVPRG